MFNYGNEYLGLAERGGYFRFNLSLWIVEGSLGESIWRRLA
ncbi:hypothetical protein XBO1_1900019 [Xenorhabdus bovienii str. oregonense]|uniref:Uncharacterized protein n=1 Tax=Xenorhabdus bovienii str. oregonense TaxID=1398202 RepID=A0A077NTA7_XENBV|nr:hypothetical protein XBO1_1900019 [Xenorhabdus bovienii str. oregonense]